MSDTGRLPADAYLPDMGGYPNHFNRDLDCICCGVPEGSEHRGSCQLRGKHVSCLRLAYECGYQFAKRQNEAVMKAIRGQDERRYVLCSAGCCFRCEACAAKTGSPLLCQDCLRRRAECAEKHEYWRTYLKKYKVGCYKCGTLVEVETFNPPPAWTGILCSNCQVPDCDTPTIVTRED